MHGRSGWKCSKSSIAVDQTKEADTIMEGQLKNGTILTSESGNKYEVVSLLGAGGQGEVYDVKCGGNHYALKGSSFISSWLRP